MRFCSQIVPEKSNAALDSDPKDFFLSNGISWAVTILYVQYTVTSAALQIEYEVSERERKRKRLSVHYVICFREAFSQQTQG